MWRGPGSGPGRGELLFGTVDSWLIWKLTGGRVHVTDYTNASRTMLFDIQRLCWDEQHLPDAGHPHGDAAPGHGLQRGVRHCRTSRGWRCPSPASPGTSRPPCSGRPASDPGEAKNTYGTGCFLLMNTGRAAVPEPERPGAPPSPSGLDGTVQYALEGSVFVGGAVIQWLRDELRFFTESRDAEYYASKVPDTGGRLSGARPSPAWGPPTGICTPGAAWWGSPGAPPGSTLSGRPRSPSPTRAGDLVRGHGAGHRHAPGRTPTRTAGPAGTAF